MFHDRSPGQQQRAADLRLTGEEICLQELGQCVLLRECEAFRSALEGGSGS
jgi:hypothetical protein